MSNGKRVRIPTRGIVLGLSGEIGAGKTEAGKYLASKHGFGYERYSRVLAQWMKTKTRNRRALQEHGWKIMSGNFQKVLNRRLLKRLDSGRNCVVDGLRHPTDYSSLKRHSGVNFFYVYISARQTIRCARLLAGGRIESAKDFNRIRHHPVEQHIKALKLKADFRVSNNGSLREFHRALDGLLDKIERFGNIRR